MIDFSQFKKLSIGGVELKQLLINGIQAWKLGYTNLVEIATSEPGGTEIYNGIGYKDDYRWSSSNKKETAASGARITGWIPFISGATYRIKNFYMSKPSGYVSGGYIVKYNNGTITTTIINRNNADYDAVTDTFTWTETSTSIQYFRISAYKCDEQPIITMNEEIDTQTNGAKNEITTSIDPATGEIFNGIGYQDGKYISGSNLGTDETTFATGLIPYVIPETGLPPVIYIKENDTYAGNSHCRIQLWSADKVYTEQLIMGFSSGSLIHTGTYFDDTKTGSVRKLVPIADGDTSKLYKDKGAIAYIRVSHIAPGANCIIRIGTPIE